MKINDSKECLYNFYVMLCNSLLFENKLQQMANTIKKLNKLLKLETYLCQWPKTVHVLKLFI